MVRPGRSRNLLALLALTWLFCANSGADEPEISVTAKYGKFQVMVKHDLFCEVDFQTYEKPIVYPIYGPHQVPMTRSFPMKDGVDGEASDHPHHKSMWFGHGDVNGVSFWHGEGKIVTEEATIEAASDAAPAVVLKNRLVGPDGKLVARETMRIGFGASDEARWIDWDVTVQASAGEVVFGDTKEGTAALRVHPKLRLDAGAKAVNSEGIRGGDVWGKSAKWVDYSGTIDNHHVGIAFLDHPDNLRHPTHWHARTYGLFAANPFGLSQFVGEGQDGAHTVGDGDSLRFQYRIVFHKGGADQIDVERQFQDYAGE